MIPRTVAITPGDGRDLDPWLAAIAPHLDAVVIREPGATVEQVQGYVALIRDGGALAIVHARSAQVESDGVHVPDGAPVPVGNDLVGASCHDVASLDRAFAAGATYAFLSPVFDPISKTATRSPLGIDRFVRLAVGRPVLALGGIDVERAGRIFASGHGVAMMGFLFGAADPAQAGRRARAVAKT